MRDDVTKLILVRHAEAEGNIIRRFHGNTDSPLTENGHRQAKLAAERLADEPIDVIYTSDLQRAYQTAGYIAEAKNLPLHKVKALREIHGGDWEDMLWADLPIKWPDAYRCWEETPHLLEMPNGETMKGFYDRLVGAVTDIVKKHPGKSICIVTHGTAKKALLCYFYQKPLKAFIDLAWHDNAAITVVQVKEEAYEVLVEGDNTHLGELSTLAKQDWWKKKE